MHTILYAVAVAVGRGNTPGDGMVVAVTSVEAMGRDDIAGNTGIVADTTAFLQLCFVQE